jgi:hypothetical protein
MENDQAQAVETQETPENALLAALDDSPPQEDPAEEPAEGTQPEEASEEPPQEEDKPAVDQKFRVKIKNEAGEDEDRDLSLEELAAGYMQSADYTRKAQALAAERKQQQDEVQQAVSQVRQQAVQRLEALESVVMQAAAPELQNVNWLQLSRDDPARFVQLQAQAQQLNSTLGAIQAEKQRLEQERQQSIQQQREQSIKNSLDYLSKEIPGFNLKEAVPRLRETGKKYGFSDEELSHITDGRAIHLLHDAMKWRELQTAKPKALQKVADAPKVVKPAAPQPKKPNQAALQRLKATGRASELVNFL